MPVDGTLTTIIVLVLIAGALVLLFRKRNITLTDESGNKGAGGQEEER